MKSFLRMIVLTLTLVVGLAPSLAVIGSSTAYAAIEVPDITTTDNEPGKAVKSVGVKFANTILLGLTGIAVATVMAFFAFLAGGKPFPRFLVMPALAVIGATSIGWLLKLVAGAVS